ncbi:histone deacetylase [Streptomyces sp. SID13031]|uniref:histone deacetylase n=1 Tax=Streptomyces sp. SID13031 TaxID=2706046 RepID=UPI0013CD592A|nr:histone deacetylase [Streptomyces sp. SID13031]NEA30476.1 histone deacetylase [Streptomyces sp. SID13031]
MSSVWYVAYGSNLALNRFRCYLSGGRPPGGMRDYTGCRDPSEPSQVLSVWIPGGLVFSGESKVWTGGSAFYDPDAGTQVAARAYLITVDQFADVVAQEMRRPPGGEFALAVSAVASIVEIAQALGPGRYETLIRVALRDGVPMLTMTHGEASALEPAAPSAAYLGWIGAGLREAHGWDAERIADYLSTAPGVRGVWGREELVAAVER